LPLPNRDIWIRAGLVAAYKSTIGDVDDPDTDGLLAAIDP
jgi:hypothetical protein